MDLKTLLDAEVAKRDSFCELSYEKPDPIMIAKRYKDEFIALICALFAYGNASLILRFLDSLDFSLLDASEEKIAETLKSHYYRFQNSQDVATLFIALRRFKLEDSIEAVFQKGYAKEADVMQGLGTVIAKLHSLYAYESRGYRFLIGSAPKGNVVSPYKRWHMYLRWMVRKDCIDMGLWKNINRKDLLLPLDTHTFKVAKTVGLLKRKTYDFKAVIEVTKRLKEFDPKDPIKYDFALYRLGQEGDLYNFLANIK